MHDHRHLFGSVSIYPIIHMPAPLACTNGVHCIVPGGGVTLSRKWKTVKGKGKYLFPVKAMSKVFRGKYLEALSDFLFSEGMELGDLKNQLYRNNWIVYSKPTPRNSKNLISYLARYTHQIAISTSRIKSFNKDKVAFSYTDYRHANQKKVLTLSPWEFVRRLSLHILPHGFTRIRHYGILSSGWIKELFPNSPPIEQTWMQFWVDRNLKLDQCPLCKKGKLILVSILPKQRGPPTSISLQPTQN